MVRQLVFALLFMGSVSTFAQEPAQGDNHQFAKKYDKAVRRLLSMNERPTIAVVKKALKPWPRTSPVPEDENFIITKEMLAGLAEVIVYFEHAFPGAVYLPMGRDAVGLGDMMDAFYTSIGQPGRIRRLDFSRPTVNNANSSDLVDYLKGLGFKFQNLRKSPTFVIFDSTGYQGTSQLGLVLDKVYTEYARRGHDPKNLVYKFNAINLYPRGKSIDPEDNPRGFLEEQAFRLQYQSRPDRIFAMPEMDVDLSGSPEWHDSFGTLYRDSKGKVQVQVPEEFDEGHRLSALFHLYEIVRKVETPAMKRRVKAVAKKMNVEINLRPFCDSALAS